MPTLLHIDSSPMGDASISRHLTSEFVKNWKLAHPDGKVVVRDLTAAPLVTITAPWVGAAYTPAESRTPEQNGLLALSETLIEEIFAADEIVFGVPMHNFGTPSVFKLYIDQICRVGRTFAYVDGSPKGLVAGKKASFLIATGGMYDAGTAMASFNFVEPYLRSLFSFLGVTDTYFQTAGGTAALNYGGDRAALLAPQVATIEKIFATA
jgi:FMN-dependent NADH-azoreductase